MDKKINCWRTEWVDLKVCEVQITIDFIQRCDKSENSSAQKHQRE